MGQIQGTVLWPFVLEHGDCLVSRLEYWRTGLWRIVDPHMACSASCGGPATMNSGSCSFSGFATWRRREIRGNAERYPHFIVLRSMNNEARLDAVRSVLSHTYLVCFQTKGSAPETSVGYASMDMKCVLMVTAKAVSNPDRLAHFLCNREQFLDEGIVDSTTSQERGGDGRRHLTRPRSMF